jgi:hypothetical protein
LVQVDSVRTYALDIKLWGGSCGGRPELGVRCVPSGKGTTAKASVEALAWDGTDARLRIVLFV